MPQVNMTVPATKKVGEVKPKLIRTVYGRMVDPHTNLTFDLKPSELFKMTPWVQSQIEAGKMVLEG